MHVEDVMKADVKSTTPDDTLINVARLVHDNAVSSVVVMDGDRLAGIVTERDLIDLVAEGVDPHTTRVGDRISTIPDTVEPRSDIAEAAEHMARLRIRQLPVVDKGKLVGIISIRDLTDWAVEEITGGHELPDLELSHTALSAAAEINRPRLRSEGAPMETVNHRSTGAGHWSCPSCGAALEGDPRMCPSCGAEVRSTEAILGPEPQPEPPTGVSDSLAGSWSSSSRRGTPWRMIVPLIAAGLIIVLLSGWVVSLNRKLVTTKTAPADARARVTSLTEKVDSIESQVDTLKHDKRGLETQNSSLASAMVDCENAAAKMREFLRVLYPAFQGRAFVYDFRTAAKESNRAWSVCREEANATGAI